MVVTERISFGELFLALFRDPWRKLVSIGLAVGLWHYLDAQVSASEQAELPLTVVSVAGDLDTSGGLRLNVRMDTGTFSVIRFEDPVTAEECDTVTLFLAGAKSVIESIEENPGYMVLVEPALEQGELIATFSAEDVRTMNSRFEGLIARMSPPRIVARVGRNIEKPIAIGRDQIEFVAPSTAPDLAERLLWDDAKYEPKVVKMRGPAQVLNALGDQQRLFRFAPETPSTGAARLDGLLRSIDVGPQVTLIPDSIAIEVPIRSDPRTFRLPDVRVLLHEPDELRGRFKLRRDTVDVEIEAFRTLEAILSGLSPDERRKWAHDNAYLVASLPRDATDSEFITNPRLVVRDYYERSDYRMTVPPTVHFDLTDR